jgi:hypothetical protein
MDGPHGGQGIVAKKAIVSYAFLFTAAAHGRVQIIATRVCSGFDSHALMRGATTGTVRRVCNPTNRTIRWLAHPAVDTQRGPQSARTVPCRPRAVVCYACRTTTGAEESVPRLGVVRNIRLVTNRLKSTCRL